MKASLLGADFRAVFNADATSINFSMEGKYNYVKRGSGIAAIKRLLLLIGVLSSWVQI
jgi:hypothetical protein